MVSYLKIEKRVIKVIFGFILIIAGIAMLVLPGPGLLTIFIGLVFLASEFTWAKKLVKIVKLRLRKIRKRVSKSCRKKFLKHQIH